jgi:RHS repeat-associated protein
VSDGQRLLRLTLGYGAGDNNGNLITQYTETGQQTFNQEYRYDALNRIRIAAEGVGLNIGMLQTGTCAQVAAPAWCVRYDYDGFGNAWTPEKTGSMAVGLLPASRAWYAPEFVSSPGNVTNRLVSGYYDNAGNQRRIETNNFTREAVYDAEGRISRIHDNGPDVATYLYNGEGRRVKRTTGGTTVWYVYGIDGQVVAEYQTGGTIPSGTDFLLTDHLGSTRAKFNAQNQVTARWDYEPFGGELFRAGVAGYGATDLLTHRFTGKERDPETINSNNPSGLDYFGARYFGASLGRFTSADAPFADQRPEDPQSWNLYAYVRNNPLAHVDPNGAACVGVNASSGYCQRGALYGSYDGLVYNKTRFFAAASAATQQIADVAVPILGTAGTSESTRAFLASTNATLEQVNTEAVGRILSGAMTGSGDQLDARMVRLEQSTVQKGLDNLKKSDPTAYGTAIKELNGLLNGQTSVAATVLGGIGRQFTSDGPYAGVLAGVRKSLGRDIDFAKQKDREAIGLALVKYIRENPKGACSVTANEAHGCTQ